MKSVVIEIREQAGLVRHKEPVALGIPLVKGDVFNIENLQLVDDDGNPLPVALTPIAWWHDQSVKWLLVDFQVDMAPHASKSFKLTEPVNVGQKVTSADPLQLLDEADAFRVVTGLFQFAICRSGNLSLQGIEIDGNNALAESSRIVLTDEQGQTWMPYVEQYEVERHNEIRSIIAFSGCFRGNGKAHTLRFKSRLHFFAGQGTVRIDFTLWNPEAACHPQCVWDLGDAESVFFKGLSCEFSLADKSADCFYALDPKEEEAGCPEDILIYQDSSGGRNWRSHNHVNRHGAIPLNFQGYEVRNGKGSVVRKGKRTTPVISLKGERSSLSCTIPYFWQNFPKALSCNNGVISVDLFPGQFADVYELQGGEQKTHSFYLHADSGKEQSRQNALAWVHHPLVPHVDAEQYYLAALSPRPVPCSKELMADPLYAGYQNYITTAVQGERSFFERREIIDEYGWRNFGDMYADHEAVVHSGDGEFVSHYNNQYDGIKGGLFQFMRTGESEWFRLADELARHVADIDIYRTDNDRYQYNGGLFWHTDHHLDAATATHRTTSKKHFELKDPRFVGGGPSYEHNYSTGFCYYYWMTGEKPFKECVLLFAQYVIRGLEGPDTLLEYSINSAKKLKSRLKKSTGPSPFGLTTGPGRGSGNALNTLLDAYLISSDEVYLERAEWLIGQCVSPWDDVASRNLLNAELRWMYTIFMQSLGRYLDVSMERGQVQGFFEYARSAFLNYADWMLDNEYPYLEKPELLEFPNETWAAQDIRKADILALAARYCEKERQSLFLRKSRHFFEKSLQHVLEFKENSYLTRPIVVVMTNGLVHMDVYQNVDHLTDWAQGGEKTIRNHPTLEKEPNFMAVLGTELKNIARIARKSSLTKEISWLKNRMSSR